MNQKTAETVLNYLKRKRMCFCWLEGFGLVSRTDCRKTLGIELSLNDWE